jgi:hypothetical protein
MQCFKDVVRTKDKLQYRKVTRVLKVMSPLAGHQDMQCFKDVVRTKDKLLKRKGTHVLLPWQSHVAGHAVLQGCGTCQR